MEADLAEALRRGGDSAGEDFLEQILAGAFTGYTAIDDAAEERGASETVGAVDTARELTAGVEAFEGGALAIENLGLVVDFDAAHCEMQNRLHDGHVEGVVDVEGEVVEEFLAEGIFLLTLRDGVVVGKGLLQGIFGAANVLGELFAGHLLHQASAGVVPCVEVEDVGGFGIEDESDGPFLGFFLFPHLAGDVVTVAELVREALAGAVQEETAFTTESYVVSGSRMALWTGCTSTYLPRPKTSTLIEGL